MRIAIAVGLSVAGINHVAAGQLDGKWVLSNGDRVTISGTNWRGEGYDHANHDIYRGKWRKVKYFRRRR